MIKVYCDKCGKELVGKEEQLSAVEIFTIRPDDVEENKERDTNLCGKCRKELEGLIAPFFKTIL